MQKEKPISAYTKFYLYSLAIIIDFSQLIIFLMVYLPGFLIDLISYIGDYVKVGGPVGFVVFVLTYILGFGSEAFYYAYGVLFYILQAVAMLGFYFAYMLIFRNLDIKLSKFRKKVTIIIYRKILKNVSTRLFATQVLKLLPFLGVFPANTLGVFLSIQAIESGYKNAIKDFDKQ